MIESQYGQGYSSNLRYYLAKKKLDVCILKVRIFLLNGWDRIKIKLRNFWLRHRQGNLKRPSKFNNNKDNQIHYSPFIGSLIKI